MEQVVQTEEVVIVFDYPCHYLLSTFGISYLLVHVWDIVLIGVTSRFISNIICVGLGICGVCVQRHPNNIENMSILLLLPRI